MRLFGTSTPAAGVLKLLIGFLLVACDVWGQTSTKMLPDCEWYFQVTGTAAFPNGSGAAAGWDNRTIGCNFFVVVAENVPGTGTPTLTFQAAVTVGGVPTSWGTFSGTNNPSTDQVSTIVASGYQPWLRVLCSSCNTVTGRVFGWKRPEVSGGAAVNVNVGNFPAIQAVVQTAACPFSSNTNVTNSGNTLIVPVSGSLKAVLCQLTILTTSPVNWKLTQGTGGTCGTGTGDITPLFPSSQGGSFDLAMNPWFNTGGNAICFNQSSAVVTAVKAMYRYE